MQINYSFESILYKGSSNAFDNLNKVVYVGLIIPRSILLTSLLSIPLHSSIWSNVKFFPSLVFRNIRAGQGFWLK